MTESSNKSEKETDSLIKQDQGLRQDVAAWCAGMLFIVVMLAAMFGAGHLRGWDAQSGYTHNTSSDRFLPEPFEPEPGVPGRSDRDAASRWYYWQLPPDEANALTRLFVWLCYVGHQLTIWATIYYAQKKKTSGQFPGSKYSSRIYGIQWIPLLLNMFFHVVHLAQTHLTYDATAQDVSEASSQSSVIVILVLVLLMEYRDRGLFFGWPAAQHKDKVSRKLRLSQGPINLVRKYHGYAFAWGAIYTFWYHPMDNTWGHALGFLHTWMIMLQGSLMYTNVHLNRLWRLTLEAWVCVHGTLVAMQTASPDLDGTLLWPMFCFGFLWIFTMTQIFGFSFWKKLPWWTRAVPFMVYLGVCVWCYSWIPDKKGNYYIRLPQEIPRIPAIEYASVFYAWLILEIFQRIEKKMTTSSNSRDTPLSPGWETLYLLGFVLLYMCMVIISFLLQQLDAKLNLIVLMITLIFIFTLFTCAGFIVLSVIFKGISSKKDDSIAPTTNYGSIGVDTNGVTQHDGNNSSDSKRM